MEQKRKTCPVVRRMIGFLLLAGLLLVPQAAAATTSETAAPGRHILILHSYHEGYAWTDAVHGALRSNLVLEPQDELHVEFLDLLRNPSDAYREKLAEALRVKLAAHPPDLILVSDNPALDFLQQRLPWLKHLPVVFCGINAYDPARYADMPGLTGINEEISIRETVDVALALRPNARTLAVVSGMAQTEQRNLALFKDASLPLPRDMRVRYFSGMAPEVLGERLSELTADDIVLYLGWLGMPSGEVLSVRDSMTFVHDRSQAAVFGMWDFLLPYGSIGGMMVHGTSQGESAAQVANEVLAGKDSASVPVRMESPNRMIFNERELARFGIDVTRLPEHALLVERVADEAEQWRAAVRNTYFSYELFAKHGTFMWIIDPESGIILDANDAMVTAYGYPDLIGRNVREINALDEEALRERMRNVQTNTQNRLLLKHVLADGRQIDVQIDSYPVTVQGRNVLFSIVQDVTDRIAAEHALAQRNRTVFWLIGIGFFIESTTILFLVFNVRRRRRMETEALRQKTLLEQMADNSYDVTSLIDQNGCIVFESNAVERLLGRPKESYYGRPVLEFLHAEDRERIRVLMGQIMAEPRKRMTAEFRMSNQEGEWLWLEANAINLLTDSLIKSVLVNTRDITERKVEQLHLIEAKEAAEQALKTQKRFLANMSHEIRTPMNGFIGMIQLLRVSSLEGKQKDMLVMAEKSSRELMNVLNDILEMSRMEAGKVTIRPVPYQPSILLKEIHGLYSLVAAEKGIALKITMHHNPVDQCLGDPVRIKQILGNLVGNAIKFTEQGYVQVSVSASDVMENNRIRLTFQVVDTGIGIAPDQLERIFDAFAQADGTYAKAHQGTGLGLSISRSLARLMDGDITVVSEVGKGSRFTFAYPTTLVLAEDRARETS